MGFRRQDLQEAFLVPGTHAFKVSHDARGIPVAARLVQDFGGPVPDGAADPKPSQNSPPAEPSPTPPERRRGRPPGSRTQKPA